MKRVEKMENDDINNLIIKIINVEEPESLEKLLQLVIMETSLSKEEALKIVLEMENTGKIRLNKPPDKVPGSLNDYILSKYAVWFWSIIIISLVTMNAVFTLTSENSPLMYLRYILGTMFVLFLPGYSLVKALFPGKKIDNLERVVLSIGVTLSLLPVVGLLLNYTPWGIRLIPVSLFLLVFTISLALIGIVREYQQVSSEQVEKVF